MISERLTFRSSLTDKEMEYLHDIIKGGEITEEFEKLLNGVAALESIATADALYFIS